MTFMVQGVPWKVHRYWADQEISHFMEHRRSLPYSQ